MDESKESTNRDGRVGGMINIRYVLNDTSLQSQLSNLTQYSFTFRGIQCNSIEGLLQGLKFEDVSEQKSTFLMAGHAAKKKGFHKSWWIDQTLYWDGTPIKRDSQEYQDLLDEVYEALFTQNEKAKAALIATGDAVLKHSIGKKKINETILTEREFCSRLMNIRNKLKAKQFLEFDE